MLEDSLVHYEDLTTPMAAAFDAIVAGRTGCFSGTAVTTELIAQASSDDFRSTSRLPVLRAPPSTIPSARDVRSACK
jgi:hypothetical protein